MLYNRLSVKFMLVLYFVLLCAPFNVCLWFDFNGYMINTGLYKLDLVETNVMLSYRSNLVLTETGGSREQATSLTFISLLSMVSARFLLHGEVY